MGGTNPSQGSPEVQLGPSPLGSWEQLWQTVLAAVSQQVWGQQRGVTGRSASLQKPQLKLMGLPKTPDSDAATQPWAQRNHREPLLGALRGTQLHPAQGCSTARANNTASPGRGHTAGLGRRKSSFLLPHDAAFSPALLQPAAPIYPSNRKSNSQHSSLTNFLSNITEGLL